MIELATTDLEGTVVAVKREDGWVCFRLHREIRDKIYVTKIRIMFIKVFTYCLEFLSSNREGVSSNVS